MPTVLLIEDDAAQRMVASHTLRRGGHTVVEAADGEQGLLLVGQCKPDIVVCDVVMPRMTGFQVLSALRENAATATLPVIMLTAMSGRDHMRHGMTAGADDYLPKPYQPVELMEAVTSVLARHETRRDAAVAQMKDRFIEALDRQEQILKSRFEDRLAQELSSRWEAKMNADGQLVFENATLLVADLFSVLRTCVGSGPDSGPLATAMLQAARDSLFLFGADQIVPYGEDMLAVFSSDRDDHITSAAARATRAAFALQSAVASALRRDRDEAQLTVALHSGDMTLVRIADPLHGDGGNAPVPGEALQLVASLRQFARGKGWAVAASAELVESLPAGLARASGATALPGTGSHEHLVAELTPIAADRSGPQ